MCYKVTLNTHREGDGDGGEDEGHPLVPLPLLLLPPCVQSQPRILLQEVQNLYRIQSNAINIPSRGRGGTCEWTRGRTTRGRRYWIHSTTRVKVFPIQGGQVSTHCTLE